MAVEGCPLLVCTLQKWPRILLVPQAMIIDIILDILEFGLQLHKGKNLQIGSILTLHMCLNKSRVSR